MEVLKTSSKKREGSANEIDDVFDEILEKWIKSEQDVVQENDDIFDETLERELKRDHFSPSEVVHVSINGNDEANSSFSVTIKCPFYDTDIVLDNLHNKRKKLCDSISEINKSDFITAVDCINIEEIDDVFNEEQVKKENESAGTITNGSNGGSSIKSEVVENYLLVDVDSANHIDLVNGIKQEVLVTSYELGGKAEQEALNLNNIEECPLEIVEEFKSEVDSLQESPRSDFKYQCAICSFKAKREVILRRHLLLHEVSSLSKTRRVLTSKRKNSECQGIKKVKVPTKLFNKQLQDKTSQTLQKNEKKKYNVLNIRNKKVNTNTLNKGNHMGKDKRQNRFHRNNTINSKSCSKRLRTSFLRTSFKNERKLKQKAERILNSKEKNTENVGENKTEHLSEKSVDGLCVKASGSVKEENKVTRYQNSTKTNNRKYLLKHRVKHSNDSALYLAAKEGKTKLCTNQFVQNEGKMSCKRIVVANTHFENFYEQKIRNSNSFADDKRSLESRNETSTGVSIKKTNENGEFAEQLQPKNQTSVKRYRGFKISNNKDHTEQPKNLVEVDKRSKMTAQNKKEQNNNKTIISSGSSDLLKNVLLNKREKVLHSEKDVIKRNKYVGTKCPFELKCKTQFKRCLICQEKSTLSTESMLQNVHRSKNINRRKVTKRKRETFKSQKNKDNKESDNRNVQSNVKNYFGNTVNASGLADKTHSHKQTESSFICKENSNLNKSKIVSEKNFSKVCNQCGRNIEYVKQIMGNINSSNPCYCALCHLKIRCKDLLERRALKYTIKFSGNCTPVISIVKEIDATYSDIKAKDGSILMKLMQSRRGRKYIDNFKNENKHASKELAQCRQEKEYNGEIIVINDTQPEYEAVSNKKKFSNNLNNASLANQAISQLPLHKNSTADGEINDRGVKATKINTVVNKNSDESLTGNGAVNVSAHDGVNDFVSANKKSSISYNKISEMGNKVLRVYINRSTFTGYKEVENTISVINPVCANASSFLVDNEITGTAVDKKHVTYLCKEPGVINSVVSKAISEENFAKLCRQCGKNIKTMGSLYTTNRYYCNSCLFKSECIVSLGRYSISESSPDAASLVMPTITTNKNKVKGRTRNILNKIKTLKSEESIGTIENSKAVDSKIMVAKEKLLYSCSKCSYQTYNKKYLYGHRFIHSEAVIKCNICSYFTNSQRNLAAHMIIHLKPNELKMWKCSHCPFETKRKINLNHHMILHKKPEDIKLFQCDKCSYQGKRKSNLMAHVLKHKTKDELVLINCALCSFKAKSKSILKAHMLVHQDVKNLRQYKCDLCSYTSIRKVGLTKHSLVHKRLDEIKTYNCINCQYKTKYKSHLQTHLLTHKNREELKMLCCEQCSYKTLQKSNLNCHMWQHKKIEELNLKKCEYCSFQTKFKGNLNKHISRVHSS